MMDIFSAVQRPVTMFRLICVGWRSAEYWPSDIKLLATPLQAPDILDRFVDFSWFSWRNELFLNGGSLRPGYSFRSLLPLTWTVPLSTMDLAWHSPLNGHSALSRQLHPLSLDWWLVSSLLLNVVVACLGECRRILHAVKTHFKRVSVEYLGLWSASSKVIAIQPEECLCDSLLHSYCMVNCTIWCSSFFSPRFLPPVSSLSFR